MKIIITAREALEEGLWEDICDLKGWNVWAMNEGMMKPNKEITLTEKDMEKINYKLNILNED